MNGIDVACVSQRIHQWHADYDGWYRLDEIADDGEERHHQQHNQMRIVASDAGDPVRDNNRTAQIDEKPTKRVGRADRDQRQRNLQTHFATH